jgi:DNA-binding IscR family transcriptional regulator
MRYYACHSRPLGEACPPKGAGGKCIIALKVILNLGRSFFFEEGPKTRGELSQELNISNPLVKEIIHSMAQSGFVSEVLKDNDIGYQPAKPLEKIGIKEILYSIKKDSAFSLVQKEKAAGISPEDILTQTDDVTGEALKDLTVKDLILSFK